jgi:hypothetical protein
MHCTRKIAVSTQLSAFSLEPVSTRRRVSARHALHAEDSCQHSAFSIQPWTGLDEKASFSTPCIAHLRVYVEYANWLNAEC